LASLVSVDLPHIVHGGGSDQQHAHAGPAAYRHLTIPERMLDRSDRRLDRGAQMALSGPFLDTPLTA